MQKPATEHPEHLGQTILQKHVGTLMKLKLDHELHFLISLNLYTVLGFVLQMPRSICKQAHSDYKHHVRYVNRHVWSANAMFGQQTPMQGVAMGTATPCYHWSPCR